MGIVEAEPDVFYISTSDIYTHESYLHQLDLRGWVPGQCGHSRSGPSLSGARPRSATEAVMARDMVDIRNCFSSLIWRVGLKTADGKPTARVWLKHDNMGYFRPDEARAARSKWREVCPKVELSLLHQHRQTTLYEGEN